MACGVVVAEVSDTRNRCDCELELEAEQPSDLLYQPE